MKVKSLSRVRLLETPWTVHGIFQARVLEWGATVFSAISSNKSKHRVNPEDAQAVMLHPPLLSIVPWEAPQIPGLMSCYASGADFKPCWNFRIWFGKYKDRKKPLR